jgi:hypothetical protein
MVPLALIPPTVTTCCVPPSSVPLDGTGVLYCAPFAVTVHEKDTPPVFAMVNCACALRQTVNETLDGLTASVAGTGVAVGEAEGVGDGPGEGEAPGEGDAVSVGVARRVVVGVIVGGAPENDCDEELEFAEEALLEDAEGARIT